MLVSYPPSTSSFEIPIPNVVVLGGKTFRGDQVLGVEPWWVGLVSR